MTFRASHRQGMSLIEVLVAIAIAGLLAILVIPKFMDSRTRTLSNTVGRTEQLMQAITQAIRADESSSGQEFIDTHHSLESTFYKYGNYLGYLRFYDGGGTAANEIKYFLLADGSRISITPLMFSDSAHTRPEYGGPVPSPAVPVATPITTTTWADPDTGVPGYCGDYNAYECLYLDVNGKDAPNTAGKNGDIIPLHVDFTTGAIRTLYQSEQNDRPTLPTSQLCKFVSNYDIQTSAPGASACP